MLFTLLLCTCHHERYYQMMWRNRLPLICTLAYKTYDHYILVPRVYTSLPDINLGQVKIFSIFSLEFLITL